MDHLFYKCRGRTHTSDHTNKQRRAEKKRFVVMEKKVRGESGVSVLKMMMVMLMCAVTVSLMMTTMIPCVNAASKKPEVYKVGGTDHNGWRPEFDYMVWARKYDFYVGDSLYFGYNRSLYNILEVNKTDYETCRANRPIAKISSGNGRDVFNLTSAKSFYFLSGGGYCFQGMRLAVTVKEYTGAITASEPQPPSPPAIASEPQPPSPPAINNTSPMSASSRNVISTITGAVVLAWNLLLKV